MPRYTITPTLTSGLPSLFRDGMFLALLGHLTDTEQDAILRGLNGPSEATAKRVAELRELADQWRQLPKHGGLGNELHARDLESQAQYLESTL